MLDFVFRPHVRKALDKCAVLVLQSGLTPNLLTAIGFFFGLAACFAVGMQAYPLGLILILLNRFFDGLAGMAARIAGITALGSYLDIVCDFVIFAGFVFFFSLGLIGTSLAAAFLIFSYLTMAVAYLAQTSFETRANVLDTPRGGLIENTEMILFMAACCLMPPLFPALAPLFGLLCFTTAILRVLAAIRVLRSSQDETV